MRRLTKSEIEAGAGYTFNSDNSMTKSEFMRKFKITKAEMWDAENNGMCNEYETLDLVFESKEYINDDMENVVDYMTVELDGSRIKFVAMSTEMGLKLDIDLKAEKKALYDILGDYEILHPRVKAKLRGAGYTYMCLGSGRAAYASSMFVNVWDLNNSYAKGRYFGVGAAAVCPGHGQYYYAYVKEVK